MKTRSCIAGVNVAPPVRMRFKKRRSHVLNDSVNISRVKTGTKKNIAYSGSTSVLNRPVNRTFYGHMWTVCKMFELDLMFGGFQIIDTMFRVFVDR